MKKDPRVYLAQIIERLERIKEFTAGGRKAFLKDRMAQDAVIRNFEVIGEAAKRVPDDFRRKHPEIPWKGVAAFRDVLIHNYEGVNIQEVWNVIEKDLPHIEKALKSALPPLDKLEREISDGE
jgi:uncharacterized protein with HEPN domain